MSDVVVLLHSGGMSSRQWRKLSELLAPTNRVIAPDFLGSGANPPWPTGAPFHFTDDVDVVERLIAKLDAPVHLVGHSYGGLVALMLARRDPSRVRSLVVYDPVAYGVLDGVDDADGLADAARVRPLLDASIGGSPAWLEQFVDYWSGVGAWRTLSDAARAAFVAVGPKVFLEVVSLIHDRTPASAYADIRAPALVLVGETTPVAAKRVAAILARALPSASLHEVAGAGHMGPITHADAVNERIARHIRGG